MADPATSDPDHEMSPEERLSWLRERGVQVVTPEERKASSIASALREADSLAGEEVTLVYIPANSTQPLQEVVYAQKSWAAAKTNSSTPAESNAALFDFLKPRFQTPNADVDLSRLDASAQTLLASDSIPKVSDSTLRAVAQDVHIETFTIAHSVNNKPSLVLYLDEVGALKRLPVNVRAASYASRAGFNPPPVFYGDVYAGRMCPLTRRNVSCRIEDVERVNEHMMSNLTHQMEQNRALGRPSDARQPDVAGSGDRAQLEDGFSWRQTEQELEVTVPITSGAGAGPITSKQVKVEFRPQSLQVSVAAAEPPIVLSIRLFERVDVDSCTWTLDATKADGEQGPAQSLVVSMEKAEEALWPRIRD